MPEGDTIHRTARTLRATLEGRAIVRIEAPLAPGELPSPGELVERVEARGKHLLIHFSGGATLHTHMRMSGSWHVYRPGARWRRPAARARVVIEVDAAVAVCFDAPVVEFVTGERVVARLGPDLTSEKPDLDEALRRMDALDPRKQIGEVLLDQRVACGIGNVYKSEVLWIRGIDPFRSLGSLGTEDRGGLLATASRLLRANLTTHRRTTVPEGLAVYRRAGLPCRRCGGIIERRLQGREQPRSTYRCPSCQA